MLNDPPEREEAAMVFDVLSTVREVPQRVLASRARVLEDLGKTRQRLQQTRDSYSRWLRRRVFEAREASENQLWELHVSTLERAQDLLERAPEVPVFDRVGTGARELLEALERATTHPPMADYDDLNVRKVMSSLRDLDRFGLLRVHRYEAAHRNRKTILDAVQRELEHRSRLGGLA
jgi:hypothetical protein